MKNNLNCNGCRYTVEKNRIACDCCVDRSNYSPRQRIRYGEDKDPATIVFWADGTKTVVKALYEKFDPEKGLAMAIAKKALGNRGNYFNRIKVWTEGCSENKDK